MFSRAKILGRLIQLFFHVHKSPFKSVIQQPYYVSHLYHASLFVHKATLYHKDRPKN